MHGETVKEIN